jgi:hypothetical protein
MKDIIDVRGVSGAAYRFTRFRDGNPLSAMGGNYVYVREVAGVSEVIYAGEAQNLLTDARLQWDRAVCDHAAEQLYTRLNISERTRRQEHADIVGGQALPMNHAPEDSKH